MNKPLRAALANLLSMYAAAQNVLDMPHAHRREDHLPVETGLMMAGDGWIRLMIVKTKHRANLK